MKLYGTATSPYVRRIRFVLEDLGVPYTLVDVFSDEGQAELRTKTPLWKVPTLDLDGEVLWDSGVILERLFAEHGFGGLRAETEATRWQEARLRSSVDEVLNTLIKFFYLRKDGVDVSEVAYLAKDQARVHSTLEWLEGQLRGDWCSDDGGFGRTELYLYTLLDWIDFREVLPLDNRPGLLAFAEAHRRHPLLEKTAPPR